MDDNDLIGTKEAADLLKLSEDHIRHLAVTGSLKNQRVGRVFLFKRADVRKYQRVPVGRPSKKRKK